MTRTTRTTAANARIGIRRTHVVWVALLASMTGVGGVLLVSEKKVGNLRATLPAAVATTPARSLDAIYTTRSPVETERWAGIVIHHSGSISGSPDSIARDHQDQGLVGLGYHFVISNGRGAPDGEIHVGFRWLDQQPGAHVVGPNADKLNRTTIGICLVGDGERRAFTPKQIARLTELIASLQKELGLSDDQVVLHREVAASASPGRLFPEAAIRARLREIR